MSVTNIPAPPMQMAAERSEMGAAGVVKPLRAALTRGRAAPEPTLFRDAGGW